MVHVDLTYTGGLRCEAIHGPSNSKLVTDAPVDNHGRGEAFSPTDLATTSLGACMATVMGILAAKSGIALEGMTVALDKIMSSAPPRRIAKIVAVVRVPLAPDHPHRAALEAAALGCPVFLSLHPDIEKDVTFEWVG